jgi:hypothetical protein
MGREAFLGFGNSTRTIFTTKFTKSTKANKNILRDLRASVVNQLSAQENFLKGTTYL